MQRRETLSADGGGGGGASSARGAPRHRAGTDDLDGQGRG
jgi:hypothetical protein